MALQKFEWSATLETGVASIDTQHKELVHAINDLAIAIETGTGAVAIKKLLAFLEYYAEWHFDSEEGCAARHQCPIAATNAAAHQQFLTTVKALKVEFRQSSDGEAIARQAHQQLSTWLVSHILKIDTQIGQHIHACQT